MLPPLLPRGLRALPAWWQALAAGATAARAALRSAQATAAATHSVCFPSASAGGGGRGGEGGVSRPASAAATPAGLARLAEAQRRVDDCVVAAAAATDAAHIVARLALSAAGGVPAPEPPMGGADGAGLQAAALTPRGGTAGGVGGA